MRRMGQLDTKPTEWILVLDVLIRQPYKRVIAEQIQSTAHDQIIHRVGLVPNLYRFVTSTLGPISIFNGIVDRQQVAVGVLGVSQFAMIALCGLKVWPC